MSVTGHGRRSGESPSLAPARLGRPRRARRLLSVVSRIVVIRHFSGETTMTKIGRWNRAWIAQVAAIGLLGGACGVDAETETAGTEDGTTIASAVQNGGGQPRPGEGPGRRFGRDRNPGRGHGEFCPGNHTGKGGAGGSGGTRGNAG